MVDFVVVVGVVDVSGINSVTANFTGEVTGNMVPLENNAAAINLAPEIFTVTATNGSASALVGLNSSGQIRIYGNRTDGVGNTLLFEVADGYSITKVTFTFGSSSYTPTAELKLGSEVTQLAATDLTDTVKTYDSLSVKSFFFT